MLLCGSCNRAKSWSCEHCANLTGARDPRTCGSCYWAQPEDYAHVALRDIRRVELVWDEGEAEQHVAVVRRAERRGARVADYIKRVLAERIGEGGR